MGETMQRRDFLKLGGGLITAAVCGQVGLGVDEAPPKKRALKKAVMYGTIGLEGSVFDKFQALKAAGFEGVEPMSHMDQDEVLKALDTSGLKAASVCGSLHWKKPLSSPDPKVRQEGLEGLLQTLRDAKHYGAATVLLVPGVVNKEVSYDDCFKRSVAEIRKAVPLAEKLGVKIAIENVWNNFVTTPQQAVAFLDAIDSPQVGWHFDIGNTLRYSPPETWIPVLGKRIIKLHFKEFGKVKQFNVRFFEGDNNWPAIMKALDEAGYQGTWGISEQPPNQAKDAASLRDLSERLGRVFAS